MVWKRAARRAATGGGVFVLSGAMVLAGASPARADWTDVLDDLAVAVPAVATSVTALAAQSGTIGAVGAGVCATGVGCIALGVGALVVGGASLAFMHRDTIASWFDHTDNQSNADGFQPQAGLQGGDRLWAGEEPPVPGDWMTTTFDFNPVTMEVKNNGPLAVGHWWVETTCHALSGGDWFGNYNARSFNEDFSVPVGTSTSGAYTWFDRAGGCGIGVTEPVSVVVKVAPVGYTEGEAATALVWQKRTTGTPVARRAVIQCKQAGTGDTYEVEGPIGYGTAGQAEEVQVTVPQCDSGDMRIGTRLDDRTREGAACDVYLVKCPWVPQALSKIDTEALSSEFPDCESGTPCVLRVIKPGGGECTVGDSLCIDWWPDRDLGYGCKWGPYSIGVSNCRALKHGYDVSAPTEVDVNGFPTDLDEPGDDVDPTPAPTPTPSPTPTPPPGPPVDTEGTPVPEDGGCGINWTDVVNPVRIVYLGTSCALKYAFVPSASAMAGISTQLDEAFESTGVPQWVDAASGVPEALGAAAAGAEGGSCEGPGFELPLVPDEDAFVIHPLSVCDEPMSTVAPIVKVVIALAVIVAGVRGILRPVLSSVDMGDSVK